MKNLGAYSTEEGVCFPKGFTVTDNRIEDDLQRFLTPTAYCVWRQYLRFWGGDKKNAYPSLALLSERTGISEKTIRKANKELVVRGFLKYIKGNSVRCNVYIYVPIDEIIEKYSKELIPAKDSNISAETQEIVPPTINNNKITSINIINNNISIVKTVYSQLYKKKTGSKYVFDKSEEKLINDEIDDKTLLYINQFFKSRNSYIENSDYSFYFFMRPKVQKLIVKEFIDTNNGRWMLDGEEIYQKVKDKYNNENVEEFIKNNVRLPGANKERDSFIKHYIEKRITHEGRDYIWQIPTTK